MKKLKERWNIQNNWQLIIIIAVFSITGSAAVWCAKYIIALFGIGYLKQDSPWVYYPIRILLIFPLYQVLLICIGTLLGQFKFFWQFEKKMLRRFGVKI